jgi:transcriptional regulator with XRE-family HTH domain
VGETIGLRVDRLKALREERGWSQREMARLCGLGITSINKYELSEVDPSSAHLKAMAATLDVSADYLLGLTNDPKGFSGNADLNDDEQAVLHALRRDGWRGVARVLADRLPG